MVARNTSDNIEEHIKQLLEQMDMAVLKRSELAELFQVVPSQINYVIKTRFTESKGYIVESKRGGGGYIRIGRISYSNHHQLLLELQDKLASQLSEQVYEDILLLLVEEGILERREATWLLAVALDSVLGSDGPRLRTQMMRQLLKEIDRRG
ncbi:MULTISPECIES: CtsR family transcriptional regulator [unclassified Streptococcus]|uniref:CtsR family transcriptional regulator n=1 Tax=unclassified Streptococcus TaxID=2608887 RepID=UPI001071D04E|nr:MULTISPECIES: CtsR family transcriptional regulator [unclassified Streptococcus]MBF0806377.1 CtsR family transcriptional regulator [Streptococcus sp. 19428wA2_WM07]TFU27996.1 CtsR family transcriptional regulator [Streptococcus sp. WM07]